MTAHPAITVVMPLYNKGPHVEAAVNSVLGQRSPCDALIVVDDGSTDGGRERVEMVTDPRVRLLRRSPPGPGGYAARNLAIREASTEWICFLDADDTWTPDHLAEVRAAIASAPSAGCVISRFAYVYGQREVWAPVAPVLADSPGSLIDFERFLRAWTQTRACPVWTGAVAFRRSVLIDAGLFPEGGVRRGGDKDLWLRAMALTEAVYTPAQTALFAQETVNKVTKTVRIEVPSVVGTIRTLLPSQPPHIQKLLRRLSNQEVAKYSRWSLRLGGGGARLADALYLPEGLPQYAMVSATGMIPPVLRRALLETVDQARKLKQQRRSPA